MPKQRTDDLMQLIRAMTGAEKRHFRLFARRNQASEAQLFLQIFDVLDQREVYDETLLLKKIPALKRAQLANIKAHLYRQILTSLRLLSKNRNDDIQVREMIDYARTLYDKGLYGQSLDWLARAKERALTCQFTALAVEALEFEKLIEAQYITRSLEGRAEALSEQTLVLNARLDGTGQFSNLSLQLYGLYLKRGFIRNRQDYHDVQAFFKSRLPGIPFEALDFMGKVYYCQAQVWLYHICQEFAPCFRYAQRWVGLFEQEPAMKTVHAPLYLKGLHNLLSTLFHSLHYERFRDQLAVLDRFPEDTDFSQNKNVEGLYHLYRYLHRINRHYLEGTFTDGLALIPELDRCLRNNPYHWDAHRILVFDYRIACLYFGAGDYGRAIDYLNKIINLKVIDYRADIQCFARILNLIAHFELGNTMLVEHQIRSVYRFLLHIEDLQQVQREIFTFLRRTPNMQPGDLPAEFRQLHARLLPLQQDPFERRPFLYLDIISWLETKLEGKRIEAVIQGKFRARRGADYSPPPQSPSDSN